MLFAFLVLAAYTAQKKVSNGITPCKRNESRLVKRDNIIHIGRVHLNLVTVALFLNFQLTVTYNGE
jgi:hypothetical protein